MVGFLFLAVLVGPAAGALFWHDGAGVALAAASLSASAVVFATSLLSAYLRPSHPRRQPLHERGVAKGRFGSEWRGSAHL